MTTPTLLDAALQLAAQAHAGQRRKYTQTPYLTHCLEVVNILIEHGIDDQVTLAAAALHDVIEDTPCGATWIKAKLLHMRYNLGIGVAVVSLVNQLTEPAHTGNRATRKAAECQRLSQISADAQTIKYADLISNTSSIVQHDVGFARVYLQEKWNILQRVDKGDRRLFETARRTCMTAADSIGLELT